MGDVIEFLVTVNFVSEVLAECRAHAAATAATDRPPRTHLAKVLLPHLLGGRFELGQVAHLRAPTEKRRRRRRTREHAST